MTLACVVSAARLGRGRGLVQAACVDVSPVGADFDFRTDFSWVWYAHVFLACFYVLQVSGAPDGAWACRDDAV